jgi:hypothetical protein
MRLEFGEGHFDRIEVGAVRRQKHESGAFDRLRQPHDDVAVALPWGPARCQSASNLILDADTPLQGVTFPRRITPRAAEAAETRSQK